jgi:hypothetical protein
VSLTRRSLLEATLLGVVALASYVQAARNRTLARVDSLLAGPETRPCVLCGAPMERTEDWGAVEWRRCSSKACGRSVTGTPWSALVGS